MKDRFLKFFTTFKIFFLDLLFPIECLHCNKEGEWLCKECVREIKFNDKQYCLGCKKDADKTKENNLDQDILGKVCDKCKISYTLNGVWVIGSFHDQLTQKLIKSLKYYFARDIAQVLGKFLNIFMRDLLAKSRLVGIKKIPDIFLDFDNVLVMPVPLHSKRKRWRGFNQSELLATELINYFNLKTSNKLIRTKYKKAQAKITARADRMQNIQNCFEWTGEDLNGQNIIIIDDIVTTGATLNEIARVLKDNNAGEVWGLVVARG